MKEENFDQQQNLEKSFSKKKKGQNFFSEVVKFLIIAFLVVLPLRIFIAEPFIVSGASMEPTFHGGNYLIIDKVSYRFGGPERGDVIVLRFPLDKSRFFIKRIIGLPNETVSLLEGEVYISKNPEERGEKIDEPYIKNKTNENLTTTLSEDEYFVMGDNRSASLDSRSWGVLGRDLIKGKPILRLLPITRVGINPGQ